jgi:hypothetical protein
MIPTSYNNAYEIVQTPGYVLIHYEMLDLRVIPLDGRPPLSHDIRQWLGDSRGRWEGDTLVVEVTNLHTTTYRSLKTKAPLHQSATQAPVNDLRVVERFRPIDNDHIDYRVTVEHSPTFTRPVTIAIPLRKDGNYRMFEYGCHEGNYAMVNLLRGARGEDNATEPKSQKR